MLWTQTHNQVFIIFNIKNNFLSWLRLYTFKIKSSKVKTDERKRKKHRKKETKRKRKKQRKKHTKNVRTKKIWIFLRSWYCPN